MMDERPWAERTLSPTLLAILDATARTLIDEGLAGHSRWTFDQFFEQPRLRPIAAAMCVADQLSIPCLILRRDLTVIKSTEAHRVIFKPECNPYRVIADLSRTG